MPTNSKLVAVKTLLDPSDTFGTTIFSDGTEVAWHEGRGSTASITHPDGAEWEWPAEKPGNVYVDKLIAGEYGVVIYTAESDEFENEEF